jgi:methionine synthase II (cobalamin-independent)
MIQAYEIFSSSDDETFWEIYRQRGAEEEDFMGIMLSNYIEEYVRLVEDAGLDIVTHTIEREE